MTRTFTLRTAGFARDAIFAVFLVALVSTTPAKAAHFSFSRSDVSTPLLSSTAADVNGDGKLDLIGCVFDSNAKQYEIDLALGHGDGTFSTPTRIFEPICGSIAVADTNGDGKQDLIVDLGELWVFLGNGDGTFITDYPVRSPAPASPYPPIVVDLNGDGRVDIIVADQGAGIDVGLGKGDGRFGSFTNFPVSGGFAASAFIAADFNGDGKIDLAASVPGPPPNYRGSTVSILLGNGNGTFGSPIDFTAGIGVGSLVAADFNRDGKLDLAVSNYQDASVSILLGNGNGTFLAATNYPVLIFPGQVVAGDFNDDGKIDLALGDGPLSILPGLGDGTFGPRVDFATVSPAQTLVVADFDLDQKPDVLMCVHPTLSVFLKTHLPVPSQTHIISSGSPTFVGQPVTFTATVTTPSWTIPDGELVTFYDGLIALGSVQLEGGTAKYATSSLSPKTHTIKASYPGDTTFMPSQGAVKQVVQKYPSATTLTANPNPSNFGQAVTFTAQVTSTGPVPTGRVRFLDGTVRIGAATLNVGIAKLTKSTLAVGTHPITVQYLGDPVSGKSVSPVVNQVVNP